ncbi:LacI family DNA-binding transcriptional regulator [Amycolatopsis sp. NPDC059657]|uniref:LacI family DNA-binding transcriptional regulator n=1 Tax=Amycolatopsis sp. NPDC059657 TaxID=3346899 RepID=UPI00366F67BB
MATISDVAARAGVSTATVSRALNGKSTVDPELAARVQAAATELGYHPNSLARNLRRQETAVLALIIADVENPFFTSIARGFEDIAQTAGYSVVLCNTDENEEKERRYINVALQERVAGVVLSPSSASTDVKSLRERGTPIVAVDRPLPDGTGDQVLVDSRRAAHTAAKHLLDNGYRRIACVTGPSGIRTADERLEGYQDALCEAGLSNDLFRHAEYRAGGARVPALELLDSPHPPDALIAANSMIALDVLQALTERNLRPGRDIGVVTFDDPTWAKLIDPPLTVMAQPAYDIGVIAARMLLDRIADNSLPPASRVLEASLVERASSRRR